MIVYHPKEHQDALKLFNVFVDFVIQQLNEDKIAIAKKIMADYRYCSFEIWLVRNKDFKKEIDVSISYDLWRGLSTPTPIERFELMLCQDGIIKADLISQGPDEYDKMLELFNACLNYIGRHDPERHKNIVEKIDLSSLERKNWKKTRKAIEQELVEDFDMRMATQDFDRKKERALADLTSKYVGQGYEITE